MPASFGKDKNPHQQQGKQEQQKKQLPKPKTDYQELQQAFMKNRT